MSRALSTTHRPLTAATITKAETGDILRDQTVRGLHLRASSSKKSYYLYYKTKAGIERRPRIGDAHVISLSQARDIAKGILAKVATGGDPAQEARDVADRETVSEFKSRYLEHQRRRKKDGSCDEDARQWDKYVTPAMGEKSVVDVTERDVYRLHHAMRGTPYQANRVVAMLRKAFNLAVRWGVRKDNPVTIEFYPEEKRRRYPVGDEPARLFAAMDVLRDTDPAFVGLVELLALTGCRRGEIQTARREWVQPDGLHLPDSKGGQRIIPLSAHARAVVAALPQVEGNPYLIPGALPGRPMVNVAKRWKALLAAAGIADLRFHDLRRFYASAGLSSGLSLEAVGQLLGHTQSQTTKRYAFLMTDAATQAAQAASEAVALRLGRQSPGSAAPSPESSRTDLPACAE